MDIDDLSSGPPQMSLFDLGENSSGSLELFPTVWAAAEALLSADSRKRINGLKQLANLKAARFSPLIAYYLSTFILENDLEFRGKVVEMLGKVLQPDEEGKPAPDAVRQCLIGTLSQMRTRQVYSLVQVLAERPELESQVESLLNACSYAGNHLTEIIGSRRTPLSVRRFSVRLVGQVGYLDAIPALERMLNRLENKRSGQQSMPFVPVSGFDETELLPDVQKALNQLRSP